MKNLLFDILTTMIERGQYDADDPETIITLLNILPLENKGKDALNELALKLVLELSKFRKEKREFVLRLIETIGLEYHLLINDLKQQQQ